jgi:hypothetical protein
MTDCRLRELKAGAGDYANGQGPGG